MLVIACTILAADFRAIGSRYISLTLRSASDAIIRRYRFMYGVGALVGMLMPLSGILRTA